MERLRVQSAQSQLGITVNLSPAMPASGSPADQDAARRIDARKNRFFLDALLLGKYPADMLAEVRDFGFAQHIRDGGTACCMMACHAIHVVAMVRSLRTMAMTALDYESIRQLLARYARALDFGDGAGVAACFAPDGFFELSGLSAESPNGGRFQGRESLREFVSSFFAATQGHTRHWAGSTPVIEGDGQTATGWVPLLVLRPGETPHTGVLLTAIYQDEYVKTGDAWLFAARRLQADPQPEHAATRPNDVLVVRFDEAHSAGPEERASA